MRLITGKTASRLVLLLEALAKRVTSPPQAGHRWMRLASYTTSLRFQIAA